MNIISIFIVLFLYFYGFILIYITILAKKKGEKEAFINNLAITLVFLIAITINLIIIDYINPINRDFILFPFDILTFFFILIFLPIFFLLMKREKKKIKNDIHNNKLLETKGELPLKYDIYRKLSHLIVLGIIFFYFTLGFLIQNIFIFFVEILPEESKFSTLFYSIFTIKGDLMIFTQYLVLYLVTISLIGLLTADFIRILKPDLYPLKPINQILREKELHMRLGPHISMSIGCFSIIILYGLFQPIGPLIICTSMTMTIFGDIAANLIGRTFGKKKISNTEKTYEGLFAGISVSFFAGIIILFLLRKYYLVNLFGFILLPLIGAIIIGILDYLDLNIDDNLTFILITTTVLFFLAIIII
ncbi:MAG: hypothetical protein ACTSPD_13010 [Promethearchaeota archaeon]